MDVRTRSIAEEASANYCNNIWIGLYSQESGKRIDYYYTDDVQSTNEEAGTEYEISFASTSHNNVYLVAVANSDVNSGISDVAQYGTETEKTLRQQLNEATTLEKFEKICMLRPDKNDVNVYATSLTMSGWYATESPGTKNSSTMEAVTIKEGANNLSGAIYLKRLISYNKFIIVPGKYVNLKLNTWQVCNVPHGCYLFEQDSNVGDKFTNQAGGGFYNSTIASHFFTAATNADGVEGHSFEFYQVENKHTAVGYDADKNVGINPDASDFYNEREREFKADGLNTGIYRSLVASASQDDMSNNHASYVVVNATVDYYVAAPTSDDETFDPTTALPIDPSSGVKMIHRTAIVNYTIHLGYCEDKENGQPTIDTAKDFNCRRNTKYTYNVTINGVKNIVVEAKSEDGSEPQPGAEGWVSDEYGDYEDLDSHYCEFNISLTDEERANMSYRITAPYGGNTYVYYKQKDGSVKMTNGMDEALYSWIKFYPTTAKDVLAEYNGGKGLWSFDDLCGKNRKTDGATPDSGGNQWYTVFVDEYVYHIGEKIIGYDEYDPTIPYYDETSWANYVNKDDRVVEFLMHMDESKDTESSYSYCKYAFGQKSIQSYYRGVADANGNNTGIGVEHTEETYCMNMYWDFLTGGYSGERSTANYSYSNGRYNLYHYVDTMITEKKWEYVIQQTKPAHVDADSNPGYGTSHPAADYPVYMPTPAANATKIDNSPSPKDNHIYYANSICMNRNRDLNGNGEIDPNEIRWYLPTSSVYMQISISQNELPDPIMPLTEYDKNYFDWSKTGYGAERYGTYVFHYITSDYQYYWAEIYVSTGDNPFSGYGANISSAYTARCVRNLGTKPSVIPTKEKDEVGYAYKHDAKAHTFTMDNFTDVTLRGYNLGGLAPHEFADPADRPYKKFEYSKTYCTNITGNEISVNGSGYIQWGSASSGGAKIGAWRRSLERNDICGQYSQEDDESDLGEWRVPSACEMAFLWTENILQDMGSYSMSATHEHFVTYDLKDEAEYKYSFLGYNNYYNRHVLAMDILYGSNEGAGSVRVRCVRDVK
jgi:hypothetical protein